MLTALALLGVLAVLFLVFALATRDGQALAPALPDAADAGLPAGPVRADDVRGVRFGLALRGYRMSEVDTTLARVAEQLEERDRQLASLRSAAAPAAPAPEPATLPAPEPVPEPAPEPAPEPVALPAPDPVAAGEAGASAVDLPAPPVVPPGPEAPVAAADAGSGASQALPVMQPAPTEQLLSGPAAEPLQAQGHPAPQEGSTRLAHSAPGEPLEHAGPAAEHAAPAERVAEVPVEPVDPPARP